MHDTEGIITALMQKGHIEHETIKHMSKREEPGIGRSLL